MGANLALNMERNGFRIAGYDLEAAKGQAFVAGPAAGRQVELAASPERLMAMLKRPRRVLMMVPAGAAVDSAIAHLKPHLQPGDILIDGGNSWFLDTERRSKELAGGGFHYVGTGVSGGEQGALWGPAIMPGGQREAWDALAPVLRAIAAKADDGEPCVDYMGPGGAGHYVKMVHNGIEYGDMQLIAEAYDLLARGLQAPGAGTEHDLPGVERRGPAIVPRRDHGRGPREDRPRDRPAAGGSHPRRGPAEGHRQVDEPARLRHRRADSHDQRRGREPHPLGAQGRARPREPRAARAVAALPRQDASELIDAVRGGPLCQQGDVVRAGLRAAAGWRRRSTGTTCRPGASRGSGAPGASSAPRCSATSWPRISATRHWRTSCSTTAFRQAVESRQGSWRFVVQVAVEMGIPVPAMSASLAYFDAYRSERLPANLTQGQRDYFGAHTYRRIDKPGVFHTEW